MINCNYCAYSCETYRELALHISGSYSGHNRGKKWAAKYLTKVQYLNSKRELPNGRIPLTEQDKENKEDSQRELSGELDVVITQCPTCKNKTRQPLPIEYVSSSTAWRNKQNIFLVNCEGCRK